MLCALRVGELFIVLCPLARTHGSDLVESGLVCVRIRSLPRTAASALTSWCGGAGLFFGSDYRSLFVIRKMPSFHMHGLARVLTCHMV